MKPIIAQPKAYPKLINDVIKTNHYRENAANQLPKKLDITRILTANFDRLLCAHPH